MYKSPKLNFKKKNLDYTAYLLCLSGNSMVKCPKKKKEDSPRRKQLKRVLQRYPCGLATAEKFLRTRDENGFGICECCGKFCKLFFHHRHDIPASQANLGKGCNDDEGIARKAAAKEFGKTGYQGGKSCPELLDDKILRRRAELWVKRAKNKKNPVLNITVEICYEILTRRSSSCRGKLF